MTKMFKAPNGQYWTAPVTRELAIAANYPIYLVLDQCPDCKLSRHHMRYVDGDRCKSCVRREAYLTRIMYVDLTGGFQAPDIIDWENQTCWTEIKLPGWKPWSVPDDVWQRALDHAMLAMGDPSLDLKQDECRKSGHILIKKDGKCLFCSQKKKELTPRQKAKEDGEMWYMPEVNCEKCGKRSLKRVNNGECRGCHPTKEDLQKELDELRGLKHS